MPEYADIYVVEKRRTPESVNAFLEHFLPSRRESADEYCVPQYSESPVEIFTAAEALIAFCCQNPREPHAIYWHSTITPEHAMAFFLEDGGLICGISTPADNPRRVDAVAAELGRFLGTQDVLVTYEDLPPASVESFTSFVGQLPRASAKTARGMRAHRAINL
jgi:hypothetical protein